MSSAEFSHRIPLPACYSVHHYIAMALLHDSNYAKDTLLTSLDGFLKFFPKRLGIFNHFLLTYYSILSTLDYKFLFKYLQL